MSGAVIRRAPKTIELAPIVATTLAGLGSPSQDGRPGYIRMGSGIDTDMLPFVWDLAQAKWLGLGGSWRQVIHSSDTSPIVLPSAFTTKQYAGDPNTGSTWGLSPFRRCALMYTAGFRLEYWHQAFVQRNATGVGPPEDPNAGQSINVGTYFYQLNSGDDTPAATSPPTNGTAETAYLGNGVATLGHSAYRWRSPAWATLGLLAGNPTKDMLHGVVHAYMDGGASSTGSFVDYSLFLRWVGVP